MDATPVFVKVEEYKEVLDILEVIKRKLKGARQTLAEINRLKEEEDRELASWAGNIDEIEKRLTEIDKTIFGKR
jgi:hypothetical protein